MTNTDSRSRNTLVLSLLASVALGGAAITQLAACGGDAPPAPAEEGGGKAKAKADAGHDEAEADGKGRKGKGKGKGKGDGEMAKGPSEPVPSLIVVQAQFSTKGGKPRPEPAKLVLLRHHDGAWFREEFEDPEANVFHKAIAWRDGLLTIGAEAAPKPATLKHWTRDGDGWKAETLWSQGWPSESNKFNRFRDLEIGDVDGDGADEIVIATHDQGVVAVGDEVDGTWTFAEFDQAADTFVHEIEIGDVDGDGKKEFYATPSERNRASGASQPGSVYRYDFTGSGYESTHVVDFEESHAKEILVTDVDGDGTDELYVVREAHTVNEGGTKKRVDPVKIVRYIPEGGGWTEKVVAELDDDQCRFLLPGDIDHDGQVELVAAGMESGLWRLELQDDGTFALENIDKNSGGFEHATHVADLDGDGKAEIYVAADKQKQFRQYTWNGTGFDRAKVDDIGPAARSHITWNVQDGVF